ncbi:MAG TPA: hypothetical protein VHG08_10940 [Longimicrobium sp.]|nr:hypothetical protein [Longimicrobium sp.]
MQASLSFVPRALVLAALVACAPNPAPADAPSPAQPSPATLTPFGSGEAFAEFQREMVRAYEERIRRNPPLGTAMSPGDASPVGYPPPRGEPVDASDAAGLHEPGIVKAARGHLVILRGTRVHTVRVADGALQAVADAEAFAAGTPQHRSQGDGLVVAGDVAAVTAKRRDEVDVGLLRMDGDGGIAHAGTWEIRTRYLWDRGEPAVRVVDGTLVVYAPIGVWAGDPNGIAGYLPAVRRLPKTGPDTTWRPLIQPGRIYRPSGTLWVEDSPTLHAVLVCDPAGGALECRSTVVYGFSGRAHHVSRTAVYVWAPRRPGEGEPGGVERVIYRIPLDGSAPTAIGVEGVPNGSPSFDETDGGELHVLVSRRSRSPLGRAGAEAETPVALLRVPLSAFGDGSRPAGEDAYRALPNPGTTTLQTRFAGEWVLYGAGAGNGLMGDDETGRAFAARRDGGEPVALPLPAASFSGVLGFEAIPGGALFIARSLDSLHYYPLRLGSRAEIGEPWARRQRWEGDAQAHAVFAAGRDHPGLLGVALSGFGATGSVLFLRDDAGRLHEAGELAAGAPPGVECVPCGAYEFARPVFLGGRIFALVGGELVEGRMEDGRVRETRRIRFAPATSPAQP